MKLIRIKGMIALFIGLPLLFVLLVFISGPLAKLILESQLGSVNGAEVNIEDVDISYWPFTITLSGLEATDKEVPEKNLISFDKALLQINSDSLLKGKLIVSDMQLDNIQFATLRKNQGEVFKQETVETEHEAQTADATGLVSDSIDMPDIDELIKKADLKSPAAFEAFEKQADKSKKSWEELELLLEDKKKWDGYKQRYQQIKADYKKGNTKKRLEALKKLKKLNKEIKAELKKISRQRKTIKEDFENLKQAYKTAKDAPNKDLDIMKNSYNLNSDNMENISRLIFDDKITEYITLAKKYYKKLQPYLEPDEEKMAVQVERSQGSFVSFTDREPEPDFLIKTASFSAQLPSGIFQGKASDIASDQKVQNKVSIIELKGERLKHSEAEAIELMLDVRNKNTPTVNFSYEITERNISNYKIAGGDTLPLVMKSAQLNLDTEVELIKNRLKGKFNSDFNNVNFTTSKKTDGRNLSSMIASAFIKVDRFNIKATANGQILKPKLKIKSDIDNKINKQLKVRLEKIKKEYAQELKVKLKNRYAGKLNKIESAMSGLNKYKKDIDAKQSALENKLNKYKK